MSTKRRSSRTSKRLPSLSAAPCHQTQLCRRLLRSKSVLFERLSTYNCPRKLLLTGTQTFSHPLGRLLWSPWSSSLIFVCTRRHADPEQSAGAVVAAALHRTARLRLVVSSLLALRPRRIRCFTALVLVLLAGSGSSSRLATFRYRSRVAISFASSWLVCCPDTGRCGCGAAVPHAQPLHQTVGCQFCLFRLCGLLTAEHPSLRRLKSEVEKDLPPKEEVLCFPSRVFHCLEFVC